MLPNISFVGHLSGLVIGVLFASGGLNLLIPSPGPHALSVSLSLSLSLSLSVLILIEIYTHLELCCFPSSVASSWLPQLIPSHDKPLPFSSSPSSLVTSLLSSLSWLLLQLWNLFALLCHIIGLPCDEYLRQLCASSGRTLHLLSSQLFVSFGLSSHEALSTHDTMTTSVGSIARNTSPRTLEV
jgi:hypothetical protein